MPEEPYPFLSLYREKLVKLLVDAYDILYEYQLNKLLATDPPERSEADKGIKETKAAIAEYEADLKELDLKLFGHQPGTG